MSGWELTEMQRMAELMQTPMSLTTPIAPPYNFDIEELRGAASHGGLRAADEFLGADFPATGEGLVFGRGLESLEQMAEERLAYLEPLRYLAD